MTSQNTLDAINFYKLVLKYEALLRSAKEELDEKEKFIPVIEKEYYKNEIKILRDLSEGRDVDEER